MATQKTQKARKKDSVSAAHFLWAADRSSTWEATEKDTGDWTFYALCEKTVCGHRPLVVSY